MNARHVAQRLRHRPRDVQPEAVHIVAVGAGGAGTAHDVQAPNDVRAAGHASHVEPRRDDAARLRLRAVEHRGDAGRLPSYDTGHGHVRHRDGVRLVRTDPGMLTLGAVELIEHERMVNAAHVEVRERDVAHAAAFEVR